MNDNDKDRWAFIARNPKRANLITFLQQLEDQEQKALGADRTNKDADE